MWKSGIDKCDLPEASFIFDRDRGSIIHKCSGKPVCPDGGSTGYGTRIVISSKCPAMKLKGRFTRTICKQVIFFLILCCLPFGCFIYQCIIYETFRRTELHYYFLTCFRIGVENWNLKSIFNYSMLFKLYAV